MEKIEKPWGYEIVWAKTDSYVGKILHINPGQRLSLQYHNVKEETIYVFSGTLRNYDEMGNVGLYHPGEVLHIKPGVIHRFGAGENPVELMEVSTNHLDDVVRLQDDYNR